MGYIEKVDPEVFQAMKNELDRQNNKINLIASENYASRAVLQAQGSIMTNKYAEGYPGKRYYGGCENVDVVENLARERAKRLFQADHANVQPLSGSQANMAVYFAMLNPGDTIMGMDLSHGGHLTHGSPVSFSGRFFKISHYGVSRENETIDYDDVLKIARESKPNMIVCGASAYPRIIDFKAFKEIADEVGALLMADIAHIAGLIVAGLHPNAFPHADIVTTTTHKTLRGARGGMILCKEEFAQKIDKMIFPGIQGGPGMHTIAGKAVALKEAETKEFKEYQQRVVNNAKRLSGRLQEDGFDVVSGGTDNHLMLLNLTKNDITGKDAEALLGEVDIIVNKNTIPFETRSPFVTSGIRLGTPAITTRGLGEDNMDQLGGLIGRLINNREDNNLKDEIRSWVNQVCSAHQVY